MIIDMFWFLRETVVVVWLAFPASETEKIQKKYTSKTKRKTQNANVKRKTQNANANRLPFNRKCNR
jgi:hypothetical protein